MAGTTDDDHGGFNLAPLKAQGGSLPDDYLWHGPLPEPSSLEDLIAHLRECAESPSGLWFEIPARDAKVLLAFIDKNNPNAGA